MTDPEYRSHEQEILRLEWTVVAVAISCLIIGLVIGYVVGFYA